jgi:protein-disulfide isomerase
MLATVAIVAFCSVGMWVLLERRTDATRAVAVPSDETNRAKTKAASPPLPAVPMAIGEAPVLGAPDARVVLIVYSEFKCPFCGKFAKDVMPRLISDFVKPGRIRVVFRHFPLDELHPFARPAAEATWCLAKQGQFWEMHDKLFANQARLDADLLQKELGQLAIDRTAFDVCVKNDAPKKVQADVESGEALGVSGTPTSFLGVATDDGRVQLVERVVGARPYAEISTAIDRLIASAARGNGTR